MNFRYTAHNNKFSNGPKLLEYELCSVLFGSMENPSQTRGLSLTRLPGGAGTDEPRAARAAWSAWILARAASDQVLV